MSRVVPSLVVMSVSNARTPMISFSPLCFQGDPIAEQAIVSQDRPQGPQDPPRLTARVNLTIYYILYTFLPDVVRCFRSLLLRGPLEYFVSMIP